MITIIPEGGLCNRMRVVASAWLLASASGQPMKVLWYRTPDFNSRFDAIFSTNELPFEVLEAGAMSRVARALFRVRQLLAWSSGAYVPSKRDILEPALILEPELLKLNGRDCLIRTNSKLASEKDMFSIFVPVGEASTRVRQLTIQTTDCVGVHVRRTDNLQARNVSTTDSFLTLMQAEINIDSKVRFFLATDDAEVSNLFKLKFGDRVWEYPKRAYSRKDSKAIVDAVVDLYALGNCRKIIGSYWSSFTDTAVELNGVECIIAGALYV